MENKELRVIEAMRKDYCECCGKPTEGWPQFIKSQGAGGAEIAENLIQICPSCNQDIHNGTIPRKTLIEIIAKRENREIRDVYEILGWLHDDKCPDEVILGDNPVAGKTYEDILNMYLQCVEVGQDSLWNRSALTTVMSEYMQMTPKNIASAVGCSASLCRKMVRTFNAFPMEESRVPFLSYRHHQIAAHTDNPQQWIEKACNNQWSTRQMEEQIRCSEGDIEEFDLEKAEKVIRMAKEVIEKNNSASIFLIGELKALIALTVSQDN